MHFVNFNVKLFVILLAHFIALIKICSTPQLGLRPRSPPPFPATSSRFSLSITHPLDNKLQFQQIKNATAPCRSDAMGTGTELKMTTQLSALTLFLNYSCRGEIEKMYRPLYIFKTVPVGIPYSIFKICIPTFFFSVLYTQTSWSQFRIGFAVGVQRKSH